MIYNVPSSLLFPYDPIVVRTIWKTNQLSGESIILILLKEFTVIPTTKEYLYNQSIPAGVDPYSIEMASE